MDSKVIVETASIGAVLLGLIFVGLELRQNTKAVESQTSQGLLELANQANNQIASDQRLAELILRVNQGDGELNELETLQYSRFVNSEKFKAHVNEITPEDCSNAKPASN